MYQSPPLTALSSFIPTTKQNNPSAVIIFLHNLSVWPSPLCPVLYPSAYTDWTVKFVPLYRCVPFRLLMSNHSSYLKNKNLNLTLLYTLVNHILLHLYSSKQFKDFVYSKLTFWLASWPPLICLHPAHLTKCLQNKKWQMSTKPKNFLLLFFPMHPFFRFWHWSSSDTRNSAFFWHSEHCLLTVLLFAYNFQTRLNVNVLKV